MTTRRRFIGQTASMLGLGSAGAGWLLAPYASAAEESASKAEGSTSAIEDSPTESHVPADVSFALNTSTIRGQRLPIDEQVRVAATAGYDGIEPWIRDLRTYVEKGGSLAALKAQIEEAGLKVVSAIGFAGWIVDDEAERQAGLEEAAADMRMMRAIGGTHMAAPPIGAHRPDDTPPALPKIAKRYRALLELGDEIGVTPQLELWGFSPTLSQLGELAYVATAAQHPQACVLPDFYHIYKGGNDFAGLGMIEASRMHCFHINDYPADPPREQIADQHRVFPGDGVCDLPRIIRQLLDHGFRGSFSLELFNPEYWQRDALAVCREGLAKSKAVVQAARAL